MVLNYICVLPVPLYILVHVYVWEWWSRAYFVLYMNCFVLHLGIYLYWTNNKEKRMLNANTGRVRLFVIYPISNIDIFQYVTKYSTCTQGWTNEKYSSSGILTILKINTFVKGQKYISKIDYISIHNVLLWQLSTRLTSMRKQRVQSCFSRAYK